jgi:hypothetical protein
LTLTFFEFTINLSIIFLILTSNELFIIKEFDAFGDVLQPTTKTSVLNPTNTKSNSNLADKNGTEQKILSTDLDSSLASLANNLDINHKNNNFQ